MRGASPRRDAAKHPDVHAKNRPRCDTPDLLGSEIISDDFFSSVFVLEFEKDADIDDTDAVCDRIFEYLDTYPEDWQFSLFVYDEKTTGAAVKKVKNACVWEKNSDKK